VSRRDQVAVTGESAMRAGKHPPGWLGDTFEALGAGRGRAPLINQDDGDPGYLGLVGQGGDQVANAPVTDPPVMPPAGGQRQHATRITHSQRADPLLHGPADDHGGGFVLGLGNPAPVPRLGPALGPPVLAPAPRSPLTRLGSPAGSRPAAGLGVVVVLAVLSADRPPRHQQTLRIRPGDRIRVDDPQIHPGHPGGIGFLPGRVGGDRHFRGHLDPQPPRVEQQGGRWPRVSRSPARAVRYTTFGEFGSRCLGMLQAHHHPPTKPPNPTAPRPRPAHNEERQVPATPTNLQTGH
jgi:hypothetical protein